MEIKDSSVEQHIKTIKELTDRLVAVNASISEEDQIVMLLGSLPSSYSTLVIALEAKDTISLSYAQQALIREEQRLKVKVRQVEVQLQEVAQGGHYLVSRQRMAENITRKRYASCVEELFISAKNGQEFSSCPSPNTKPSPQLLSMRDLMLILSVIQLREHFEHLLSLVILRDGLSTLEHQAI